MATNHISWIISPLKCLETNLSFNLSQVYMSNRDKLMPITSCKVVQWASPKLDKATPTKSVPPYICTRGNHKISHFIVCKCDNVWQSWCIFVLPCIKTCEFIPVVDILDWACPTNVAPTVPCQLLNYIVHMHSLLLHYASGSLIHQNTNVVCINNYSSRSISMKCL